MEYANNGCFLQPHDLAFHNRRNSRYPQRLARQASLTEESALSRNRDDRFFPLFGNDGNFYLALPEVENRVSRFALREDGLTILVFQYGPATVAKNKLGSKGGFLVLCFITGALDQSSPENGANIAASIIGVWFLTLPEAPEHDRWETRERVAA